MVRNSGDTRYIQVPSPQPFTQQTETLATLPIALLSSGPPSESAGCYESTSSPHLASSAKVTLLWPKAPSDYALLVHLTLTLPPLPRSREHLLPPSIVPRFLCRSSVACWAFFLTSTCGYTLMVHKAQDRERTWLSTKGESQLVFRELSSYNYQLPGLF